MNETREQEIRALKELLACEGWKLVSDAARRDWQGEPFVAKMRSAVSSKTTADAATETVRELLAQRAAIEAVMRWPEQMRAKLEAEAAKEAAGEPTLERRA